MPWRWTPNSSCFKLPHPLICHWPKLVTWPSPRSNGRGGHSDHQEDMQDDKLMGSPWRGRFEDQSLFSRKTGALILISSGFVLGTLLVWAHKFSMLSLILITKTSQIALSLINNANIWEHPLTIRTGANKRFCCLIHAKYTDLNVSQQRDVFWPKLNALLSPAWTDHGFCSTSPALRFFQQIYSLLLKLILSCVIN